MTEKEEKLYEHLLSMGHLPFLFIDVETANKKPYSICQIAIAWMENEEVHSLSFFVKPPSSRFYFSDLHGITYAMVKEAPSFKEVWDTWISPIVSKTDTLVAHYANFDMTAIVASYGSEDVFPNKDIKILDSCILSRYFVRSRDHKLPTVCQKLGIPLETHHKAGCDAEAAAMIVQALSSNDGYENFAISLSTALNRDDYKDAFFGSHYIEPSNRKAYMKKLSEEKATGSGCLGCLFMSAIAGVIAYLI